MASQLGLVAFTDMDTWLTVKMQKNAKIAANWRVERYPIKSREEWGRQIEMGLKSSRRRWGEWRARSDYFADNLRIHSNPLIDRIV